MTLAYDPGKDTPVIKSIEYAVNTTGDAFFPCTVGVSDNEDATTYKTQTLAQNKLLSLLGKEVVA